MPRIISLKYRALLAVGFIALGVGAGVFGDSIDEAEAKQRGISVQQVQLEKAMARIKDLDAQVSDLKKQVTQLRVAASNAATAPTTTAARVHQGPHPLFVALNSLPKELWPEKSEQPIKMEERQKWLTNNIHREMGPYILKGKLVKISGTSGGFGGRRGPGSGRVQVDMTMPGESLWGYNVDFTATVVLDNVRPADAVPWQPGLEITVEGNAQTTLPYWQSVIANSGTVHLLLQNAVKK